MHFGVVRGVTDELQELIYHCETLWAALSVVSAIRMRLGNLTSDIVFLLAEKQEYHQLRCEI